MLKEEVKMRPDRHSKTPAITRSGVIAVSLIAILVALTVLVLGAPGGRPAAAAPAAPEETADVATFYATADSYVSQSAPSDNYGTESYFYVRRDAEGNEDHALIAFDTSTLPDGIVVVSATLRLYSEINLQHPVSPADILPVQPEAILSSWTETGVTWNNRPPSSDLGDPTVDYQVGWQHYDVTNIAQAWVDGSVTNYGIKLTPEAGVEGWAFYWARNYGTAGPRLTIEYEAAPPPCTAVSGVTIDGATAGQTGSDYTFSASISPVDATEPFTYTWSATGQSSSNDSTTTYNWSTAGEKTVSLTVENCGGEASDSHTVMIEEPPAACETALTGLSLSGPTSGATGRTYTFGAVASPTDAETPITFAWEATDQTPVEESGSEAASDVAWSWDTVGNKQITVTAENCGASFVSHQTIEVVTPSTLPDLVPGEPWHDAYQGTVGYIVRNEGLNAAPAGHSVGYYFGTENQASVTITDTIPGGGVRAGLFGEPWSCGADGITMRVEVDEHDVVEEGYEDNNATSAFWPCDLTVPTISSGPTATDITETTARIYWTTDELTTGRLEVGLDGYATTSVEDNSLETGRSLDLTGLEPGTTYRVRAFATDEAGNETNSDWAYFETAPAGTDPPEITGLDVEEMSGSPYEAYTIRATVEDATHVERVEFYLDDILIGIQYSAFQDTFFQPFAAHDLGMTRDQFYIWGGHPLEVVAYTTGGASAGLTSYRSFSNPGTPVHLTIWVPGPGRTIIFDGDSVPDGTTQLVQVWAAQYDWECTTDGHGYGSVSGLACADANPRPASELRLYLNNRRTNTASPTEMAHDFTLDLSGQTPGVKELNLWAYADGNWHEEFSQDLILEQGTPQLRMERSVGRQGNTFGVGLTIYNDGDGSARIYEIEDLLQGFVAINRDTRPALSPSAAGYYAISSKFDNWINSDEPAVMIDLMGDGNEYLTIPPGDSFTINYDAIPVIYQGPSSHDYYIGVDDKLNRSTVRYGYAGASQIVDVPFTAQGNAVSDPALGGSVPLEQSVVAALASADYLLATSPYRLSIKTANGDQVPELLSDMARLARAADGVIGVTGIAPPFYIIDDLLEPNGYWYESLHPNFRQAKGGYVLFVGEDDVVPTQDAGWEVDYSDLRYASTGGAARPELIVGRVIGNDVAILRRPIQAAVAFHERGAFFDNSHALMWSGRAHNEGTYWDDVKAMDSRLDDTADVTRFRGKDYDSTAELLPVLQQNSSGKDWIIYRGHGGRIGFGYESDNVLLSEDVGTLDLNSRPVVMALACTTGDYKGGPDGIAEVFLNQGAAVFIGSVETSSTARNSDAARAYFNRWHSGHSVGWVLTDLMRDKWGNSSWWWPSGVTWERWVYDYQLFGDPKYGAGVTAASNAPIPGQVEAQIEGGMRVPQAHGFTTTLEVSLPDLEVSATDEGWHYVGLPDGDRMSKEGEYAVPVQTINVHYPAGERVQDVRLQLRSGMEVTTGLNIPVTVFTLDEAGRLAPTLASSPSQADDVTSWYPKLEQPFRWQIFENADGSSDLQLILYPFHYHPATTDARFYQAWRFEVHTVETEVELERLEVPPVAEPGDSVALSLDLQNGGDEQDVIVSAAVTSINGEPLAGLPLRTLHGLQGNAGVDLTWDTVGLAAGSYAVEVTLADMEGHVLDSASRVIRLGDDGNVYLPFVSRP